MDRPLGKKFDPRPKRIERSDGSYWVANPCVSEHFLTQKIGDLDRQKTQYQVQKSRQQRELERELQNIKATKSYCPGPGFFRRRGSRQSSMIETSFSDMIEKFNKHRAEQNFVNNLLRQRRESMYNADSRNRKSSAHRSSGTSGSHIDVLKLDRDHDFETSTDDEDESVSHLGDRDLNGIAKGRKQPPKQRALSRRQRIYEVTQDRPEAHRHAGRDEIDVKPIPQARLKPSYSANQVKRGYKPISDQPHHISLDVKQNKTKTRKAANLWGLVREKALCPEDLKGLKRKTETDVLITNDVYSVKTFAEVKTDDEKLQEKEQLASASNTHDGTTSSATDATEGQRQNDKIANGIAHIVNEKGENAKNKDEQKKLDNNNRKSIEHQIPNGYIPNNTKKTFRLANAPAIHHKTLPRPKSAKGRIRKPKMNTKEHTESIKSTLDSIAAEMKTMIDVNFNNNQGPLNDTSTKLNTTAIIAGDDNSSLNNYLHFDLSESEPSKHIDRKFSSFDLNIDDSDKTSERLCYSLEPSNTRISTDETNNDSKYSYQSHRNSNSSRRNSTESKMSNPSRKSSEIENALKKLREEQMNQELWDDVRKCRYLRGYDPPEMIMPANVNVFVFGKDENDIIEEIRLEKLAKAEGADHSGEKQPFI